MDVAIDGIVVNGKAGSSWLKDIGSRGFVRVTPDQVPYFFYVFKAYTASIIQTTTRIWMTFSSVPRDLIENNYIDQKLAPMDT